MLCRKSNGSRLFKSKTIANLRRLAPNRKTATGFGELFRHLSWQEIGSSTLQSDAFAGTANNTLLFCMPGSTGACKMAWEKIIREQLDSTHRPCNFATHYMA